MKAAESKNCSFVRRAVLAFALVVTFFSQVAFGAVWYEPFANPPYADNTRVGGNSVWGSGNSAGVGSATVSNVANLSYSGLLTTESSGGLVCVTNLSGSNRFAHTNAALSVLGGPIVPGPGTNIYLSFLINIQSTPASDRQVAGLSTAGPATTTPTSSMTLGINSSGQLMVGKNAGINTYGATTATGLTPGDTYFVVMRYNWQSGAANDTVDLWLNPAPGGAETLPDISATSGGADLTAGIQAFAVYQAQGTGTGSAYGGQSGVIWIDEIRLATTWEEVTPPVSCVAAQVTSGATPGSAVVNVGGTANFSITASGSDRTYFWQESTDGSNWNPAGGATDSPNYTTPALFLPDTGKQYRCVVSNFCDSASYTSVSDVATVTVQDLGILQYRSANGGGNWDNPGSWEVSSDGSGWGPASGTPSDANSTITIRAGHPISVTSTVSADQLTVEAGATLEANGAVLTISDGVASVDCSVLGTLQVANSANSTIVNNGGLTVGNGGRFVWARAGVTAVIPVATWEDGSICEIQDCGNSTPTNLNQSYYDFYWNKTSSGAVNLGGQLTTVRNDLRMKGSGDAVNSVRFLGSGITCDLNVGGDFIAEQGYITFSGGSAANTILNLTVAGNFTVNSGAIIDSRTSNASTPVGSEVNIIFNNTVTPQTLIFTGDIGHTGAVLGCPVNWKILSGVTVTLSSGNLKLGNAYQSQTDSVTVDGTLDCDGNQIVGINSPSGTLTINGGGTIVGEGTSQIASSLSTVNYGGTLSLPNLPGTLNNGDNFLLFGASSYNGLFTSITPATTPVTGFAWDDSQLAVSGTLYVGSAVVPVLKIDTITRTATDITLKGTGGTPGGFFNVLTSGSLATPLGSWSIYTSGQFDGSGNFDITFPTPGTSPSFFVVQQ